MAAGGVVGPIAFVTAWALCGRATPGYSPSQDAISQLAAIGAPTRLAMTLGFVVFGIGVVAFARPLRQEVSGPAGAAAAVCGLATLGVAAVPLGWVSDGLHGAFAGIGYVALTGIPLLASLELVRRGKRAQAIASVVIAVVCGACLVATTVASDHGLFQRIGLSVGDVWLVVSGAALLARPAPRRPDG